MRNAYTLMESNLSTMAQNTRLDIIGELDAIIQYETHINSSVDPVYRSALQDIVNEEKVHVGQFLDFCLCWTPQAKNFLKKA